MCERSRVCSCVAVCVFLRLWFVGFSSGIFTHNSLGFFSPKILHLRNWKGIKTHTTFPQHLGCYSLANWLLHCPANRWKIFNRHDTIIFFHSEVSFDCNCNSIPTVFEFRCVPLYFYVCEAGFNSGGPRQDLNRLTTWILFIFFFCNFSPKKKQKRKNLFLFYSLLYGKKMNSHGGPFFVLFYIRRNG